MGFLLAKRASYGENLVKRIILASVYATLVLTSIAQLLPQDEVQVLQTISSKLHNNYWNLSRSSCNSGFNMTIREDKMYSGVACNCSFNSNTVCHVTTIHLKRLNLTGILPAEFANLSHLREIDLTRNYLNGSIPTIFGQLRFVALTLLGNRISGTIPEELGNITTLEELVLEDNLLEGNIPSSLGRLSNLKRLLLSANNLNETIPGQFANLTNLTEFRIDGNTMSGRIPDFIGNWTTLNRLDMQGTSMEGPIPAKISELRSLTELRITDLRGPSMRFPNLQNMTDMKELILRNCSIIDSIPSYLGDMNRLKTLDLSFNMFNGEIPSRLQRRAEIDFLFLSHNSLTGEVPGWILGSRANIDLSYNNFTRSRTAGCQFSNVGYMAPEYAMRGYLTDKADVYSFGIVALEIVSGKSNTNYMPEEEFVYLLDWAYVLHEQGNLLELVDPILGSNYSEEEALRMLNLALLCANPSPTLRPLMSSVVSMLEGKIPVQAPIVKRGTMNDDMRFKALEMIS